MLNKGTKLGWEDAQWINIVKNRLSHNREYCRSAPQRLHTCQIVWQSACSPSTWEAEIEDSWNRLASSSRCISKLWIQMRSPASMYKVESDPGRYLTPPSDLSMHTHTCAHTLLPCPAQPSAQTSVQSVGNWSLRNILSSLGLRNYMPIVLYSLPLGLATRTPEAAPGFYRNEMPAVRQRNQVHHLPGEGENLFYE